MHKKKKKTLQSTRQYLKGAPRKQACVYFYNTAREEIRGGKGTLFEAWGGGVQNEGGATFGFVACGTLNGEGGGCKGTKGRLILAWHEDLSPKKINGNGDVRGFNLRSGASALNTNANHQTLLWYQSQGRHFYF